MKRVSIYLAGNEDLREVSYDCDDEQLKEDLLMLDICMRTRGTATIGYHILNGSYITAVHVSD